MNIVLGHKSALYHYIGEKTGLNEIKFGPKHASDSGSFALVDLQSIALSVHHGCPKKQFTMTKKGV